MSDPTANVLTGLKTSWTYGSPKAKDVFVFANPDDFVFTTVNDIEMVVDRKYMVGGGKTEEPVVMLITIFVPEDQRKKGIASRVIAHLEQRANKELGRRLVVGPIMDETDAMDKILSRRGYTAVTPFSRIQKELGKESKEKEADANRLFAEMVSGPLPKEPPQLQLGTPMILQSNLMPTWAGVTDMCTKWRFSFGSHVVASGYTQCAKWPECKCVDKINQV